MKPTNFLSIMMIAAAGLVASCSTSKLATTSQNDDVYNSVAKAREVEIAPQQQYAENQDQNQNSEDYDEYYGTSNPYYDMDYSSRINRFSNGTSWRGYFDPYYDNFSYGNSYGATNYLGYGGLGWSSGYGLGGWGGGFGIGLGYGSIWSNPFYYGNFGYGWNSPFYGWNSWGPNSYYDRFGWGGGWYGGGWGYGGGFYGGGVYTGNSNYRARPGNTINSRGYSTNNGVRNSGRPTRSGVASQNGNNRQGYAPNYNAGRPTRSQANGQQSGGYSRPDGNANRPGRNENYAPQPQRQETRPTYSAPPASRGSSGGGSYGGGGGGGSRPSRAGRG